MAIDLTNIIPMDDEYTPPLRKSSRGMRAVKNSHANQGLMAYFHRPIEYYGFLTGAATIFFLLLWVFLYSFNFEFTKYSKHSKYEDHPDPVKVFFWSLFITIIVALATLFWLQM